MNEESEVRRLEQLVKLCEPVAKHLFESYGAYTYVTITQSGVIVNSGISNLPFNKGEDRKAMIDEIAMALSKQINSELEVLVDI